MISELKNQLEVETPLGRGKAILIESADNDYYWTVVINDTRAIITFPQNKLLVTRNYSQGWGMSDQDMREIFSK